MAKSFSWSYSKYKNYDVCPKRHYEVDLQRNFTEDSEQLRWGNEVHGALANASTGKGDLPASMAEYQRWVDEVSSANAQGAKVFVEQKYAITKDFQPTAWFAGNAWYRGVADLVLVRDNVALARDYKTGKVLHDTRQLMLMAQCLFSHMPKLKRIKTEFVWLKDDCTTPETFNRDTIFKEWPPILEGVKTMEHAANTLTYPPKPGRLCARYCPVVSCPFHGKRN